MKKAALLFLLFSSLALFSQQARRDDPEPAGNPGLRDIDPQKFPSKHELSRYLHAAPEGGALMAAGQSQAVIPNPSAVGAWEPLGPDGGYIEALAVRPVNPNEMWAITANSPGQVYKTADGGLTWSRLSEISASLQDLQVDPSNPNNVYALSYNSVCKSSNAGQTWNPYYLGNYAYAYSGRLAVSPSQPNILYASGYYVYNTTSWYERMAVFKSTDGGLTWSVKQTPSSPQYAYGLSLGVDPTNSNTVYVGGYEYDGSSYHAHLYKSMDGGDNWVDITGSIYGYIYALAVDPTNPLRLYAGTYNRIYRSSDGGANWTPCTGYAYAYEVAVDPQSPNIVYAGYSKALYKSVDYGANWTYYSSGLFGACEGLAVLPGAVFLSSNAGIYRSGDGGVSWQARHSGILAAVVSALAVAPSLPSTIYAESQNSGFFKTADHGNSWPRLPDFYRCESVLKIIVSPTNASELLILPGG